MKTGLPSCSNVSRWMKCGGIVSPFASLTKPESIGCWINACTSVISPLEVARTRIVEAMRFFLQLKVWRMVLPENRFPFFRIMHASAAATADGDLDFLGCAVELAA